MMALFLSDRGDLLKNPCNLCPEALCLSIVIIVCFTNNYHNCIYTPWTDVERVRKKEVNKKSVI